MNPNIACYWVWKKADLPFIDHVWKHVPDTDSLLFILSKSPDCWDGIVSADWVRKLDLPESKLSVKTWEQGSIVYNSEVPVLGTWSELIRMAKGGKLGPPTVGHLPDWLVKTNYPEPKSPITRFNRIGREIG